MTNSFEWQVMNFHLPETLPQEGQLIWFGILGEKQAFKGEFHKETMERLQTRKDVEIIWLPVPPRPRMPKVYKLCKPRYCQPDNHSCEYNDNGYCLKSRGTCENMTIRKGVFIEEVYPRVN